MTCLQNLFTTSPLSPRERVGVTTAWTPSVGQRRTQLPRGYIAMTYYDSLILTFSLREKG